MSKLRGPRAVTLTAISALLAACSDVQTVPLGEVSRPMSEVRPTRNDAGSSTGLAAGDADRGAAATDLGTGPAQAPPSDAPAQPPPTAAADAGLASDAQVDSGSDEDDRDDDDDDDDDDSEESADCDNEEDAGRVDGD